MTPLRVLIADDELLARKRLARLLAELPAVELVAQCVDAEEVLARVREGGVDLALLDIHMPGLTGIDALGLIASQAGQASQAPLVVFCTAHPDHALAAFDGGAIDYLLKPIELERLRKAVDRAQARIGETQARIGETQARNGETQTRIGETRARVATPRTSEEAPLARLPVETRQGIVLVDPARVTHAVLDGPLVTVVTLDEELVTDFTLQDLERRLPEGRFLRVHRRALLALEHVTRLEPLPTGGFAARTVGGHVVEVSRQAARALRRRLGITRD
ncbi:MAG: response regulator [Deltaproteobacteria bacterium]|nr:response regulator [Deltaproteobacteria bacterium]